MRRKLTPEEHKRVEWIFAHAAQLCPLTERELEILISMENQFKADGRLSDPQLALLEQIWNKEGLPELGEGIQRRHRRHE